MKKSVLIICCAGAFVALPALWIGGVVYSNTHPQFGENVPSVKWLPSDATKVSYYKSYSWTAYEFDIPEQAFRRWANRWDLKPITTPQIIPRYSHLRSSDRATVTVTTGLYYVSPERPNGGGVRVCYDSLSGRGYFQSNPR